MRSVKIVYEKSEDEGEKMHIEGRADDIGAGLVRLTEIFLDKTAGGEPRKEKTNSATRSEASRKEFDLAWKELLKEMFKEEKNDE